MTDATSIAIHESPYTTPEGRRIRDAVRDLVPLIRAHAREGEKLVCFGVQN